MPRTTTMTGTHPAAPNPHCLWHGSPCGAARLAAWLCAKSSMLWWWVPAPARGSRRAPLARTHSLACTSLPRRPVWGPGGVAQSVRSRGGCEGPWGTRLGSALARPLLPLSPTFISVAPAAPGGAVGCSAGTPNFQDLGAPNCQHPTPQTAGTPNCQHPSTPHPELPALQPCQRGLTPQISAPTAPRHSELSAGCYPSNIPAPQRCLNPATPKCPRYPEFSKPTPRPCQHLSTPTLPPSLHVSAQPCTRRLSSPCAPVATPSCPLPNPLTPLEPPQTSLTPRTPVTHPLSPPHVARVPRRLLVPLVPPRSLQIPSDPRHPPGALPVPSRAPRSPPAPPVPPRCSAAL